MKWYEKKFRRHLCDMHIEEWDNKFLSEFSADWNDFFGTASNTFADKMITCREAALEKLKRQAFNKPF